LWNFGMGMDGLLWNNVVFWFGPTFWGMFIRCEYFSLWSHILRNVHQVLVFFILNFSHILNATRKYGTNSVSISLIL
jgi:hypothetical protein